MNSSGKPVYEGVPAVVVEDGVYDVVGTPALVLGCAAGDRIRVDSAGGFEVLARGGNVALVLFPGSDPDEAQILLLRAEVAALGGTTEVPADRRFIVVTVPVAVGFPAIEGTVGEWSEANGAEWGFSNVCDDNGQPLNWWNAV